MTYRDFTAEELRRIENLKKDIEVYRASISMAEMEISRIEFLRKKEAMDDFMNSLGGDLDAELAF